MLRLLAVLWCDRCVLHRTMFISKARAAWLMCFCAAANVTSMRQETHHKTASIPDAQAKRPTPSTSKRQSCHTSTNCSSPSQHECDTIGRISLLSIVTLVGSAHNLSSNVPTTNSSSSSTQLQNHHVQTSRPCKVEQ